MSSDDGRLSARRRLLDGSNEEFGRPDGDDSAFPATLSRRGLVVAAALCLLANFAPNQSQAAATAITLEVGAIGGLPGFRSGELRRYLALHMTESGLGDWRFTPGTNDISAANRVLWTFRLNPYAGGEVRSFGLPQMAERALRARRPVTIEARLYLNGEDQTLVEGQAIIKSSPDDRDLAAAVATLTRNLLGPSGSYRSIDIGERQRAPPR